MSPWHVRLVLLGAAEFVVADAACLAWVVNHPDPYGADFREGFAVLPLLALGLPWSVAFYFAAFLFVDEDSTTYPLWLGATPMLNLAIAWAWHTRRHGRDVEAAG